MLVGKRQIINIPAGVNKEDDAFTSLNYTDADKIRFSKGLPEVIGGWTHATYNNQQTLSGAPRTIYSYISNDGIEHILIGTNTRLYSVQSNSLFNITPLVTATTAIANSLTTNYATLGADPISVTNGSREVTVTYSPFTQGIFQIGDIIQISGVGAPIGGLAAAVFNASHSITSVSASTITFTVSSAATSTATGGGAGTILSTRVVSVAQIAHGFSNGDRIKILAAIGFRGFVAGDLNIENVIRNVSANAYSYYLNQTTNFATSSGGTGGAATTVQGQITSGNCTFSLGLGYGGGPYSSGSYGTAKVFTGGYTLPRIWSIDRYGDGIILTPGDQGGLYEWDGNANTAPTLVTGAPAAINYVFVGNNQAVTFGASNTLNRVKTSDSLDITNWTIDATSNAYEADILGAGRLIAHAFIKDQYLLFTQSMVFTMIYVGKPDIWLIKELTTADGIISPKAVVQVNDSVVWMGNKDFYIYNGSVLSQIPTNTVKNWVFDNINLSKFYLSFARKVVGFSEIWWFFPSGGSNEPDTYVIWNYEDNNWTNGTLTRTAAEEPHNASRSQYLVTGSCDGSITPTLYAHEIGYSDDGANLEGSLTSNYSQIGEGDYLQQISRLLPSPLILPLGSINSGQSLYTITVNTKEFDGQLTHRTFGPYSVSGSTQRIDTRIVGRQRQYVINFDTQVGFRLQKFYEEVKPLTLR